MRFAGGRRREGLTFSRASGHPNRASFLAGLHGARFPGLALWSLPKAGNSPAGESSSTFLPASSPASWKWIGERPRALGPPHPGQAHRARPGLESDPQTGSSRNRPRPLRAPSASHRLIVERSLTAPGQDHRQPIPPPDCSPALTPARRSTSLPCASHREGFPPLIGPCRRLLARPIRPSPGSSRTRGSERRTARRLPRCGPRRGGQFSTPAWIGPSGCHVHRTGGSPPPPPAPP